MNESTASAQAGKEIDALSVRVARLAGFIASEHYSNGDRAALKRHAPGRSPPLAFYRLWLRHIGEELPAEGQTAAWALLAWGMALGGKGAHQPQRPLGKALAEAGYSEARLERVLAADEDTRPDLFASLVRFMSAKGEGFNWTEAARLLLTNDSQRRESVHRNIAASYYRQLHAQERA